MTDSAMDATVARYRKGWRPPPKLTPAEWAGLHRYLSPESSAEPGLWSSARAPHLVAPMTDLSPYSQTERVVCKFSSQSGKTEILLNFIGYIIDCDPGPILAIQPNVTPMGEAFSKDRISPMLRDSPTLAEKVGQARARASASTITHKTFPSGHLTIAGANSPAGLASRPIRYFLGDEIDRWEITKEGDPMLLARKRLQTFRVRRASKELLVSSPTYDDIGISVEYQKCSQQWEWHLACAHCGATQFPRIKHFHYDENDSRTVRYVCEHCGGEHPLSSEGAVKASGLWVCKKDGDPSSIGYWFNQWASPFARWDDTLQEWIAAGNDPTQKQVVTNTVFAEPWDGEGERVDTHVLQARCEPYAADVPDGVAFITIGADVQQDRIEAEIVGWGSGEESWSLGYEILIGEPTGQEVWADLADLWRVQWSRADGSTMRASAMCVDSGNWSKNVYAWCKSQRTSSVIPIKGASPFGADALAGTSRDRRRRAAKRARDGRPAEIIGVGQIKRIIMKRLAIPAPGPGFCHFPAGRDQEYFDQLTGERLVVDTKRGKRPVMAWQKIHPQVEALDCRVYAYAALMLADIDLDRLTLQATGAVPPRRRRRAPAPVDDIAPAGWGL